MDHNLRLIAVHDVLQERINDIAQEQQHIQTIKGDPGVPGPKGKDGRDGKDGKPGADGKDGKGKDGKDGKDGVDGDQGVGIEDVSVDLDGHLTVKLTDGSELDAGDLSHLYDDKQSPTNVLIQGGSSGGGDLNLDSYSMTATFTAAETLAAGDACYIDTSGEMGLSDASAPSTAKSLIAIATASISSGSSGKFLIKGIYSLSGFTAGSPMYLSATAGDLTETSPEGSGEIIRVCGYALSTTQILFDPDKTWMEIN